MRTSGQGSFVDADASQPKNVFWPKFQKKFEKPEPCRAKNRYRRRRLSPLSQSPCDMRGL